MLTFPAMARAHAENPGGRRWLRPVGVMALLGAVGAALTALLSGLAVAVLGGEDYAAIEELLWLFVLQGTVFAVLQLLLYRQVARQAHVGLPLWLGCAALAVLGTAFADSPLSLLLLVLGVAVALLVPVGVKPSRRAPSHR
jgi:glutamine amidotransferase PdxT